MRELIRGYAAATIETASANQRLAELRSGLFGFAHALSEFDALHRVLADSTISEAARRAIVSDLLEGKASAETTALLGFVIRVERPAEVAPTLNGLVGLVEAATNDPSAETESASGHRALRGRVRGYAERVLQELSAIDEVDVIEDELFNVARVLDDNPELRRALTSSERTTAMRVALIEDLLRDKVRPATLRLAAYVLRAGRLRDLVGTFEWLVELAAEERGRRVGEVRTAVDLESGERERLAAALSRLVERPVEIRVIIDPNVIGGALISVGDLIIDGTVRLRLERLRDLLAPAS
jgi:F-type H+-transporting ATPase subunit delta